MVLFQNDPFQELDSMLGRLTAPTRSGTRPASMPMDAYRRGGDVWVHLDLPGVSTESIDISLERNVLTVSAQRNWAREEDDQMYVAERRPGVFSRQVHLGDGLDAENIEAAYHDGVLTLRLPIAEAAQPRKIAVKAKQEAIDVSSSS